MNIENKEEIILNEGKYLIRKKENGCWECLRYGEKWRDLTGDNLFYFLINEVLENRKIQKCGIDRDSKDDDCGHLNKVSSLPSKDTKKEGE